MNRAELLTIVDEQRAQIKSYKKKLKDIITAYKGLLSEKEALEATVNVLDIVDYKNDANEDFAAFSKSKPNDIIDTLRQSISTLTFEKSRNEAAFHADKKLLLTELNDSNEKLVSQNSENNRKCKVLEQQLEEVKANLRRRNTERELEQGDHGAIICELQSGYAQEKSRADDLQQQLSQLRVQLSENYDRNQISHLNSEIERLKSELFESDKSAEMTQLRNQIEHLKNQHQSVVLEEQNKSLDYSTNLANLTAEKEQIVANFEGRIAEIIDSIGDLERQKRSDSIQIVKLKAKIEQLDRENGLLTSKNCHLDNGKSENQLESAVETLRMALNRVKNIDSHANFYELLNLDSPSTETVHEMCRKRVETIENEFEKYKLKVQAVLKAKKMVHSGTDSDVEHMKSVLAKLHEKLQSLQEEKSQSGTVYEETIAKLKNSLAELQIERQKSLSYANNNVEQKVLEMEKEMQKQRIRTVEILAEKERELEESRMILNAVKSAQNWQIPLDPADSKTTHSNTVITLPLDDSPNVLHYRQEMSKKDAEIAQLRQSNCTLETSIGDLRHQSLNQQLQQSQLVDKLKELLIKADSKATFLSSADANILYLRNVFLSFVHCTSEAEKKHMFRAILSVLKLTTNDALKVDQQINDGWFKWKK